MPTKLILDFLTRKILPNSLDYFYKTTSDYLIEKLNIKNKNILEIISCYSYFKYHISAKENTFNCVDISVLENSHTKFNIDYLIDTENYFNNNKYDLIIVSFDIDLSKTPNFIEQISQLLNKNGHLVIIEANQIQDLFFKSEKTLNFLEQCKEKYNFPIQIYKNIQDIKPIKFSKDIYNLIEFKSIKIKAEYNSETYCNNLMHNKYFQNLPLKEQKNLLEYSSEIILKHMDNIYIKTHILNVTILNKRGYAIKRPSQ